MPGIEPAPPQEIIKQFRHSAIPASFSLSKRDQSLQNFWTTVPRDRTRSRTVEGWSVFERWLTGRREDLYAHRNRAEGG